MLGLTLVGAAWLVCGCVGAVLMEEREAGPIDARNIALGPVGLAIGLMMPLNAETSVPKLPTCVSGGAGFRLGRAAPIWVWQLAKSPFVLSLG
jgi:hypothetical protein